MQRVAVVAVSLAMAACGGQFAVEVTTKAVQVPVGGEKQVTLRLHGAPAGALPMLSSDAPTGVSLFPNVLASAEGDQVIAVSAAAGTKPGVSHVTLSVTSGTQVATAPLDIEVIDPNAFALTMDPPTLVVRQGHSANASLTVRNAAMHSATGPVVLSVEGAVPAGLHVTGSTVTLSGDGASSGSLSVACDPQVAAATTSLTLVATQGSLRAQLPFQVLVLDAHSPDFQLQVPSMLAVRRGGGSTLTVRVNPVMGFSDSVELSVANPPAGITVSSGSATVGAPALLTVTADATVTAANVMLTLTGAAGPLAHQAHVTLRITDSGTVDAMFGTGGFAQLTGVMGGVLSGVGVYADGRAVAVGGNGSAAVAVRMMEDGALDMTFGQGGIAVVDVAGEEPSALKVVALDDGSMLVAGYGYDSATFDYVTSVVKLKNDGSTDTTWGTQGVFSDPQNEYPLGMKLLSDGSVLLSLMRMDSATSTDTAVFVHVTAMGTLDTGFGTGGSVTFPDSYAMAAEELVDGTLALLSGSITAFGDENKPTVTWVTPAGQPATEFGTGGSTVLDPGTAASLAYTIQVRPDASIVVVAIGDADTQYSDPTTFVFQLTPTGVPDTTFGMDGEGRAMFPMMGVASALGPDGSDVVVGCQLDALGSMKPVAVRVTAAGTPDPTFRDADNFGVGIPGVENGCAYGVGMQPSGRYVVGGDLGASFSDGWFVTRLMP